MEIQVGEYIRCYSTVGVKRVTGTKYVNGALHYIDENELAIPLNSIKKHSFNKLDIIELGDYVNGYRVYNITGHYVAVESMEKYDLCFEEQDIKDILTREQFNLRKYVFKED